MKYGLIGEKLGHSFSKDIHNMLADYDYQLTEIAKEDFHAFMEAKDFNAINVTIPYKQDVIPYLDSISDVAKSIGAVNVIVNKEGKLYGYNTDFAGMEALTKHMGLLLSGKKVLILGSGGTSKTAYALAKSLEARKILRLSRTAREDCITYEDAYRNHLDAEIIINTTPAGMFPKVDSCAIEIERFTKLEGAIDAVYNPLRTEFMQRAEKMGAKASGGLYMLVAQAVFAVEHFLDCKLDSSKLDEVFDKILESKENIVLTGMPSCGKTTIGKALASKLDCQLIDTDAEIVKKAGKPITDIFAEEGEKAFRDLESQVISDVSMMQGVIISTGGGAILRDENIKALKKNGKVYFIDRKLEDLAATKDRPLSSDIESLKKRYDERYDIYCHTADVRIINDKKIEDAINAILK